MLERALVTTRRGGFVHGVLGWALATAGRRDEAGRVLAELRSRPAQAPALVSEAWLLGALGDRDGAFDLLGRAEREHQLLLVLTGLPACDALRSDPRFVALLERLTLPVDRPGAARARSAPTAGPVTPSDDFREGTP